MLARRECRGLAREPGFACSRTNAFETACAAPRNTTRALTGARRSATARPSPTPCHPATPLLLAGSPRADDADFGAELGSDTHKRTKARAGGRVLAPERERLRALCVFVSPRASRKTCASKRRRTCVCFVVVDMHDFDPRSPHRAGAVHERLTPRACGAPARHVQRGRRRGAPRGCGVRPLPSPPSQSPRRFSGE